MSPMTSPMNFKLILALAAACTLSAGCGGGDTSATAANAAPTAETGHGEATGHAEEEGHVELSDAQIQAAGLELAEAGPAPIRETLSLYGVIVPNAERTREVAARFPGVIRSVGKRIGDPVREGETLAIVEANESLQNYALVAPLTGVVTARNANPGEQTGDKPLFTVADLSTVWVELSVFPRDAGKVQVGQHVRIRSADTGEAADGELIYVVPFGQAANQTLTARVLLENPERRWAPGLYVGAQVTLAQAQVPLAIRGEALQTLKGRSVVFVQNDDGFEPRPVELGRSDGEYSEVRSGLAVGERYVTRNSFILKAELGKGEAEHGH